MIVPCENCQFLFNQKRKPYSLECKHDFCIKCILKQNKSVKLQQSNEAQILKSQVKCSECKKDSVPVHNLIKYEQILTKNKYKDIDRIVKVGIFGETCVGKTSFMIRLTNNYFDNEVIPTIASDFQTIKREIKKNTILFIINDTSGTEKYRSLFSSSFKDINIVFLLFDVTKSKDQNKMQYWVSEIKQKCNTNNIFLLGNKIDLLEDFQTSQSWVFSQTLRQTEGWENYAISCKQNSRISAVWKLLNKVAIQTKFHKKSQSVILGFPQLNLAKNQKRCLC